MNAMRDIAPTAIVMPFPSENDAPLTREVDQALAAELPAITTPAQYTAAGAVLKQLAGIVKRIGEFFDDDIAAANKIHKSLTGKKRQALEKVDARITALKRLMGAYSDAQEQIRIAAEREALAAAMQAEADRVAREAAALETAGDHALAAAVVEEHLAAPPPAVSVPSTTPRLAGVATVEGWDFEILNAALIPRQYLAVDVKKIGAYVRAMKGDAKIPGVRVVRRTNVRVSA